MANKWQELYRKIPPARRERIENYVAGMVARMDGKPQENPNSDFRNGWAEADLIDLGSQILEREARRLPQKKGGGRDV